jgi:hypothetical protein
MVKDQNGSLSTGNETFGKHNVLVLDLQKQLEETRRVCDTLTSEKLNMQILLENIRDEDRISYLAQQNKEL